MTEFATYTVNKLKSIDVDGAWCFNQVGGLEIATTAGAARRAAPPAGLGHLLGGAGAR